MEQDTPGSASHEISALLARWAEGKQEALEELTPRVYAELLRLAASYMKNERSNHTLEPAALVHEAYLRLVDQTPAACRNRSHFFALAARVMRRILVDYARRRHANKRGREKVELEEAISLPGGRDADLLALDEGLSALEDLDPRKCKVVELHYFGGFSNQEIAQTMDLSSKTVLRDLRMAEAWLYHSVQRKRAP